MLFIDFNKIDNLHRLLVNKDKTLRSIYVEVNGKVIPLVTRELYNIFSFNKATSSKIFATRLPESLEGRQVFLLNFLYSNRLIKGAILNIAGKLYTVDNKTLNSLNVNRLIF